MNAVLICRSTLSVIFSTFAVVFKFLNNRKNTAGQFDKNSNCFDGEFPTIFFKPTSRFKMAS